MRKKNYEIPRRVLIDLILSIPENELEEIVEPTFRTLFAEEKLISSPPLDNKGNHHRFLIPVAGHYLVE